MSDLFYLACPYTHEDPAVRESRFKAVNKLAARMMKSGHFVFSPISMCHPIALAGELPGDFTYWKPYCDLMLSKCSALVVLCIDGVDESTGVQYEIEQARLQGKPVRFVYE